MRGVDLNHRPPGYEPDELPAALPRDVHFSAASGTAPEVLVATRVMSPTSYQAALPRDMVPETGVEPARDSSHGILSPGRLPIPPLRRGGLQSLAFECSIRIPQPKPLVNPYF